MGGTGVPAASGRAGAVVTVTRPRNAAQTRADILSAARRRFGSEGYERTTLRAVAADVGVDAALVIRYFGSKQDLFAAAADFEIDLPDLSNVDPDDVAGILLPRFFAVWEEDETFLALSAGRDDQPARGRDPTTSVCRAGGAQTDHRHPRSPGAADRVDGCVRHRPRDHAIRAGESAGGWPQSRGTQPLGRPGDQTVAGRACADIISPRRLETRLLVSNLRPNWSRTAQLDR